MIDSHSPARDLSELLRSIGERDGRLVHLQRTAARPGEQAAWPDWADFSLIEAYRRLGINAPWVHQVKAAQALHEGHHTVIATGTGSGKSLAAWLPVISDVLTSARQGGTGSVRGYLARPTALYLSPTKALAADQLHSLEQLISELERAQAPTRVLAGTCDGDTLLDTRDWVRSHADIVLTNPDYLHFTLLPSHQRWTRFLRSLRYIIIDECHAYRGVLGAHVALVIRRLLRLARSLQPRSAGPVVLCSSATAGEPDVTASRLIGVAPCDISTVTHDTAPVGERVLALWQPALRDPWEAGWRELSAELSTEADFSAAAPAGSLTALPDDDRDPDAQIVAHLGDHGDAQERRSAVVEAAELLVDFLSVGARSLVFVRSRRSAEVVAEHARHTLSLSMPQLMDTVRAYRGGYLPEERRALESDLRSGRLRALATTNALELGIDVTGLDAVIIAGWPGTRVSLGQQAGRTGRAGARGLAVLIASDNPLDAYLIRHPDEVFAPPEATVFDPANPYVLAPHLCAAASELPLRSEDLELFGLEDDSLLRSLEESGALRRRPTGWYWNINLPGRPQDLTSLRGDSPPALPVIEETTGAVIGTVDGASADSTVHEGAVYVHQGRCYVVQEYSPEGATVVEKAAIGYRTRTSEHTSVRILAQRDGESWGDGISWSFGSVEVTSKVEAYAKLTVPSMEIISQHALDMPEHVLPTAAVWWSVPQELCESAGIEPGRLAGALHAAEHASIGILPLLATCDRWDIGGLSIVRHPHTELPTVFVYDGHAGGAGFAERGWRARRRWLQATLSVVESCTCQAGCPSCVQSPKCGTYNDPLDKEAAVILLRLLLERAPKN